MFPSLWLAFPALFVGIYAQNAPSVTLNGTGTVVGVTDPTTGLDTFLGIPYVQPPVGLLRFAAPVALSDDPSRTTQATKYGPACLQPPSESFPLTDMSEDCLTINVIRPAGLNSTANLPVLVWIYGGSLITGGSSIYNPAVLVGQSTLMGEPVIFVSFNYRLSSFGFLASSEVAAAAKEGTATLNAGLYDQRAALLWVQQNIDSFGGDHTKVTVFGESAGAISIGSFLIADGGQAVKKLNLFRGAIMESGAPSGNGAPPPAYFDSVYKTLATVVGCGPALSNATSVACLRSIPTEGLLNATLYTLSQNPAALPFNRVQDDYFHQAAPSVQVRSKKVATVPVLTGNNVDEGTVFASTKVNNSDELTPFLIASFYSNNASPSFVNNVLPQLLALYPDIPSLGSPYNPVGASKDDRFYGPTNQYKRVASLFGDGILESGRRQLLDAYISQDADYPAYSYHFATNTPGTPPPLGVYHASEIAFVYGKYALQNATTPLGKVSGYMMSTWIAFANNLQPNRPGLPQWPKYGTSRSTLQIAPQTNSDAITQVVADDYRESGMLFLRSEEWTSQVNV